MKKCGIKISYPKETNKKYMSNAQFLNFLYQPSKIMFVYNKKNLEMKTKKGQTF